MKRSSKHFVFGLLAAVSVGAFACSTGDINGQSSNISTTPEPGGGSTPWCAECNGCGGVAGVDDEPCPNQAPIGTTAQFPETGQAATDQVRVESLDLQQKKPIDESKSCDTSAGKQGSECCKAENQGKPACKALFERVGAYLSGGAKAGALCLLLWQNGYLGLPADTKPPISSQQALQVLCGNDGKKVREGDKCQCASENAVAGIIKDGGAKK